MEERENNSRKVFLSVLGVAILIVAVVGISYAAFYFINQDAGTNSIETGTIVMSYSEPEAGISLTNELPMTDAEGRVRTSVAGGNPIFDFTIVTTVTGKVAIPYEINIVPTATETFVAAQCTAPGTITGNWCNFIGGTWNGTNCTGGQLKAVFTEQECTAAGGTGFVAATGAKLLPASNVKVYLEKSTDTGVTYNPVLAPTLISNLTASSFAGTRTGALKLLDANDNYTTEAGTTTTNYRLRMWIDNDTQVDDWVTGANYQYSLRVNVDSHVAPLS